MDLNTLTKGKRIKKAVENNAVIAELWEYKSVQYVLIKNSGAIITRDEDNEHGINAAIFPYKFNSQSLLRAIRNRRKLNSK